MRDELADRPLTEPHPSRLSPDHPGRERILAAHAAAIPGPVTRVELPGAHDLKGQDAAVCEAVVRWLATLGT